MTQKIQSLLVPLDGSHHAEKALSHASELANAFGSRIVLLRVGSALAPEALGLPELSMAFSTELSLHQNRQEQELLTYLEGVAAPLRSAGLTVECRARSGDPASAIVAMAESEDVDLVVMTSHGRTGLARFFYGSVAERVLHNVRCSLLAVRVDPQDLSHS